MIRLLIADDQALVRGALCALLELETDITVVGQAGTGAEVLEFLTKTETDVVLMDVQMPGLDGIETTARLKDRYPAVQVLIVTTFGRPGYVQRALAAGAGGFVVKDTPAQALAEAVRRVHAGMRVIDPSLATETLIAGNSPLTEREGEILRVAASGGTIADIASTVFLSAGTVRNHLSSAMSKTGGRTRAEAARIALENGWI